MFYEHVLIEPLTFINGSEFNPFMWKLDNFELTYNLDTLDNLIILNKVAIIKNLQCVIQVLITNKLEVMRIINLLLVKMIMLDNT